MLAERLLKLPMALSAWDDFWYRPAGGGSNAMMGPNSAMTISTVFACVRVVAETLASLPLVTYRRLEGGGKERARDHPLSRLLHDQPNARQTSMEFRELMTAWCLLRGNAYAELVPGPGTPIASMEPIHPDRIRLEELSDGSLRYYVRTAGGTERPVAQSRMFHLRGLSLDGVAGCSIIEYARASFGLAKDAETYGRSFIRNGSRPGIILKHPKVLSPKAAQRLKADVDGATGGPERAGSTLLLEEGMDVSVLTLTNRDSQWLESRGFQREEIATWFRVPQHKVGILTMSTNNNIEHQAIEFVTDTVRPWAVRWEQAALRDLFYEMNLANADDVFVEHLIDGLLRGDMAARSAAHSSAINWGWHNIDEIREIENFNPLPDGLGQIFYRPMNIVPVGTQGALAAPVGTKALQAAQAYRMAEETAAALVKREMAAIVKAGQRHPNDPAAYRAELTEWYGDFVNVLITRLHLTEANARAYCDRHCAEAAGGIVATQAWDGASRELADAWAAQEAA